jgi:hypothetical protein
LRPSGVEAENRLDGADWSGTGRSDRGLRGLKEGYVRTVAFVTEKSKEAVIVVVAALTDPPWRTSTHDIVELGTFCHWRCS